MGLFEKLLCDIEYRSTAQRCKRITKYEKQLKGVPYAENEIVCG